MDIVLLDIEDQYLRDGKHFVRASMIANNKSVTLPTTGENVEGLSGDDYFAPGSSILTISGDYVMMGTNNNWGAWL